ncbi:hypothetical protein BO221_29705 [Archangium sp. Cb G35]|uniref:hypothetical protein n=1 Tax=Archangium sp. Cb G35 TaxID=1920190 RepID=UPI000935B79E|nr:hypothetical protein [Archangium sp. Cb G35]OJT21054.1 hypothetical protein BO221_29705 [Archangium sp. Cb G35]
MNPDLIKMTLTRLREVERYASTSDQADALTASRTTLHFIQGRGETGEFKAFVESFDTAPVTPLQSFTTKDEADIWLRNHPAPPHGALIKAANDFYTVVDARALHHRKLLRLPSPEEVTQTDEAGEEAEQEVEEAPEPSKPSPGAKFSLFKLYDRTCYDLHQMEKRMSSPEELEAIRTAKISFNFVMRVGEEYGFEEYLESLRFARTAPRLASFATHEEADSWLATQPEPPPPAVVSIGNELYSVGYNRHRKMRVLIRIPPQRELDSSAP